MTTCHTTAPGPRRRANKGARGVETGERNKSKDNERKLKREAQRKKRRMHRRQDGKRGRPEKRRREKSTPQACTPAVVRIILYVRALVGAGMCAVQMTVTAFHATKRRRGRRLTGRSIAIKYPSGKKRSTSTKGDKKKAMDAWKLSAPHLAPYPLHLRPFSFAPPPLSSRSSARTHTRTPLHTVPQCAHAEHNWRAQEDRRNGGESSEVSNSAEEAKRKLVNKNETYIIPLWEAVPFTLHGGILSGNNNPATTDPIHKK